MPQLPSVSELLIGAHHPGNGDGKTDASLPQSFRNNKPAPKRLLETSPRHTEVYLHHLGPAKHARNLPPPHGPTETHVEPYFGPSTGSLGRNLILSVGLDPHAPPIAGTDYFSYREGQRSRHMLLHSLLHLQLLLPQLHYRQRHELGVGFGTRATLHQSTGPELPQGELPTFAARPRPALFLYAPGPPQGMSFVPYHVANMPNGPGGPQVQIASGMVPSQLGGQHAVHFQPPLVHQLDPNGAYFATAGSGYPGYVGQYAHGPYVAGPMAYGAQISPGTAAAYAPEVYQGFKGPLAPFYLEQLAHSRPPPLQQLSLEDMSVPATDPNHALVNKRCIIKRRTRTGCLTCRKRRIKCDERKPHCFNCERLKKLCLGYEAASAPRDGKQKSDSVSSALDPAPERTRSSVHDLM